MEALSWKHSDGSIFVEAPRGKQSRAPSEQLRPGVSSPPPVRGGVGQRRQGQGCQGVGLVPIVSEQVRV